MSSTGKALKPGTVLQGDKTYIIEKVLGAGGFGITYLASMVMKVGNLNVRASVAIKEHFLRAHCERAVDGTTVVCPGTEESRAITADSLKDFIAEASRLSHYGASHPNIVKVNEIIEANDTAYYVMEYLEGDNLGSYIHNNGALTEQQISELLYPVIDAVAYLHSQHVTHLDIKPGNIMLAKNDDGSVRPVLIDFGLSKHYNEDGSATSTVNTMACSDGYAPMEQYMGIRTFAPTADVYALGASLYEAATGKHPTSANSWPSGEPAATIASLQLSPELKRVITRALSKNQEDRYPDAGTMLADLGVKHAASTGTPTVRIAEKKPKPAPAPIPSPSPAPAPTPIPTPSPISNPVKPQRSLTRVGLIAACAVILLLAAWGGYKIFSNSIAEAERVRQEQAEAERLAAEQAEAERLQQEQAEAERLAAERAEAERIRQEAARQEEERRYREDSYRCTTPHNLDLAVRRGNTTLYFNRSNWRNFYQSGDQKLGVVIDRDGQRFILALNDLNGGNPLTWNEAMSRFGSQLPTKAQAEAMAIQYQAVNSALSAYGGRPMNWEASDDGQAYWTKTESSSAYAWFVYMSDVYTISKNYTGRVRAVAPVSAN